VPVLRAGAFDDLTETIFAGHHQPLRVWVLALYLMGLDLSNEQIAKETRPRPGRRAADDDRAAGGGGPAEGPR